MARMHPRLLILALVAALLALPAAPASARTVLGDVPDAAAALPRGLVVTPRALLYGFDGVYDDYGIFLQRRDGDVRRLRQFDRLDSLRSRRAADTYTRDVEVAASETMVAVAVSTFATEYDDNEDYTAPGASALEVSVRGGRARRLIQCRNARIGWHAVDGQTVAFVGAGCSGGTGAIAVHDLGRGIARTIRPPAGVGFWDVRVAGRYLAAEVDRGPSKGDTIVYDWRRGRELYRARGGPVALQRDGKLAVAAGPRRPGCEARDVRWYSVRQSREHVIPGAACNGNLFLAGDRVLSQRFAGEPAEAGDHADTETIVTDLRTGTSTPLFTSRVGASAIRYPVHFDGTEVGYSVPNCQGGERIVVDTVAELAQGGPAPTEACPVSLKRVPAEVRLDRKSVIRLPLACRNGCSGGLRLWDPAEQRHLEMLDSSEVASFSAPRSRVQSVKVELSLASLRRLRDEGRMDVELRVDVRQIEGDYPVRSQPLTLLPAP